MVVTPSRLPVATRATHRLDTLTKTTGNSEAFKAAQDFLAGKIIPPLLLFIGAPGTGKTSLAYAIAWEQAEEGKRPIYYQAEELLDVLRNFEGNYERRVNRIKQAEILIVDDIGAQSDTAFGMAKLDMVIDYRYREALPTIATANSITAADGKPMIPDRILDRFKAGRIILLKGKSWRGGQA
jgi:DNA replication protein DnaC